MRFSSLMFLCFCLIFACGKESDSNKKSSADSNIDTATAENSDAGTDEESDAGTDNATDIDIPKVDKDKIGNTVFDDDELLSYHITISESEYAKLMDLSTLVYDLYKVNRDRYVKVKLRVGDTELPEVGLRLKGSHSIYSCIIDGVRQSRVDPIFGDIDVCQRFSLKLDFNRYNKDYRLDGLKALNLHAMSSDPSKMHERLGYSLFREMDILAPRAVHAKVYINGEYHGLFIAVEQVDGRFTANRFPSNGDGNLFKHTWPTADITESAAKETLKTNNDDPETVDVSDFVAFGEAVGQLTDTNFAEVMSSYLDFDYLARYLVVDRAIANFDGILSFYWGRNYNYYWYHEEAGERFTLIPWDLDKTFMVPEPNFWFLNSSDPQSDLFPSCSPTNTTNWNVVSSSCDERTCSFDPVPHIYTSYPLTPLDCDPLLRGLRDEIYERQEQLAQAFIEGPYSLAEVEEKLKRWEAQIADALTEDALVDRADVKDAIDALIDNISTLQDNLTLIMGGLIDES